MPITQYLINNAEKYPNEVCLVEINPVLDEKPHAWSENALVEGERGVSYRREMTWEDFNRKSNRFANLLLSRGVKKGDKVLISKYSGTNVKLEGEEYIIVKMEDILATVK